jgi:hypothetical protein
MKNISRFKKRLKDMEKKEESRINEEKFVRKYFIICASILILFIVLGVVETEIVIERAIRILSF